MPKALETGSSSDLAVFWVRVAALVRYMPFVM